MVQFQNGEPKQAKTIQYEELTVVDCLIVGAGVSGIAFAREAKRFGIDYKLIDRNDDLGGVWHQMRFPKLTTDSIEPIYNYVEKLPDFKTSSFIAKNPEQMRNYLNDFVNDHELSKNFLFNTEVLTSTFVGDGYVTVTNRGVFKSRYLVLGVGINAKSGDGSSYIPNFKDKGLYEGELIHGYTLDEDYNVSGKKVIVIGNGPTSIQLVEGFAETADHLTQLCRTPREILRKLTHKEAIDICEKFEIDTNDTLAVHNFFDTFFHECVFTGFSVENQKKKLGYGHMLSMNENDTYHQLLPLDSEDQKFVKLMEEKSLIPTWNSGFTHLRQLFVTTYHRDVLRPNISLVKSLGIDRLTKNGLVTKEGQEIDGDVIICATGSTKIGDYPFFPLFNKDGRNLSGNKEMIVETYWGIMNKNFPNMFYLTGPGCSGIQNIPTLAETQAKLIATIIKEASQKETAQKITVSKKRFEEYNKKAVDSRKMVAEVQKKDNFMAKGYQMDNHIYTKGENTHDFTQGGTLEYRYKLIDFCKSPNTLSAMGLELDAVE